METSLLDEMKKSINPGFNFFSENQLQKIMEKAAILTISCSYPLPLLKKLTNKEQNYAATYGMDFQHGIVGEGRF